MRLRLRHRQRSRRARRSRASSSPTSATSRSYAPRSPASWHRSCRMAPSSSRCRNLRLPLHAACAHSRCRCASVACQPVNMLWSCDGKTTSKPTQPAFECPERTSSARCCLEDVFGGDSRGITRAPREARRARPRGASTGWPPTDIPPRMVWTPRRPARVARSNDGQRPPTKYG